MDNQETIKSHPESVAAWKRKAEQLQAENATLKAELAAAQDDLAALRLFAANLNATHNATLKEMQITMRQELAAAKKDAFRAGMLAAAEEAHKPNEYGFHRTCEEIYEAIREAAKS